MNTAQQPRACMALGDAEDCMRSLVEVRRRLDDILESGDDADQDAVALLKEVRNVERLIECAIHCTEREPKSETVHAAKAASK